MKRGCITSILVLAVICVLAAVALYGVHRRHYGNIRFNGTVWRSPASREYKDNPRRRMVEDLLQHYLRTGMTRQQVRHLLGHPDYRVGEWKDVDDYFIGEGGFMSVDATALEVHYDKTDRLVSTDVVEY